MQNSSIVDQVNATLKRLEEKDPGLKQMLKKSYGYAVFPSVGKASLVVGGAYGKGAVFEKGKMIGYATMGQTTIGVQVGGDTFSEVIAFENKEALERFKKGKVHFAANASAVLVKAGASGTSDYEKGVMARAYSRGGLLLELAVGGQKFKFKPKGDEQEQEDEESPQKSAGRNGGKGGSKGGKEGGARGSRSMEESDESEEGDASAQEEEGGEEQEQPGLMSRAAGGARKAGSKVMDVVKEHPVATAIVGVAAAAGIALLVASLMRGGGDDEDEQQNSADESEDNGESDEDSDAQMSSEESDDDQEQERGDEDESYEDEESDRLTRSR